MSLFSIINDLFESNYDDNDPHLAFVFDDGSGFRSSNQTNKAHSVKYSDLKSKLNLLKTGFSNLRIKLLPFLPLNQPILFAFLFKQWNRSFYELLLSAVFSKGSFFIIDHEWPEKYTLSILSQIKPDFLIFDSENTNPSLYSSLIQSEYEVIDDSVLTKCRILRGLTCARLTRDPDIAYIISTSGTTGSPKIIEVCNSSIVSNIIELSNTFKLDKTDVVFQASPLTFDPSLIELFCSLYSKSTLLIVPKILKLLPARLGNILDENNVTTLQLTPTLFKNLKSCIVKLEKLKRIILGGENFPGDDEAIKRLVKNSDVQVYNIYGITELSCWSSLHLVTSHDLENENGVPVVGKILNETKLFLKTEESEIFDVESLISKNQRALGVLLHSSKSRRCLINGEVKEYAESGDRAFVSDGKVYLKGRDDRVVKINGKLTDLNLLEQTVKNVPGVLSCVSLVHRENFLSLFVFANSAASIESETISDHIKSSLPGHYEPRKLIVFGDQNIPFTSHGKIDVKKLTEVHLESSIYIRNKQSGELREVLKELWKKWIQVEPNDSDNFIISGGDSLKAIGFMSDLEIELKQRDYASKLDLVFDVLLNESFLNLEQTLLRSCNYDNEATTKPSHKRFKIDPEISIKKDENKPSMSKSIVCCYTKCSKYAKEGENITDRFWSNKSKYSVELDWKVNTKKCVDASPLVVAREDNTVRVFIGSHSHEFICVDGLTGRLVWTFFANDRIESSACLSKCGSYVIFGSYDKNVYVLDVESGALVWNIETNDVVKSSPCLDLETGYVFFGSHDKHFYCVNIESRNVMWEKVLDESSIFAGPTCDHENNVFVSTLGGALYSLDKNKGTTNWKFLLDKPSFTSPIFNKDKTRIYIGSCGGKFYCISFDGIKIWEFTVKEPIFSNTCIVDTSVLFGCHDKNVYCLEQSNGQLKWTSNLMSDIYSTSFFLESDSKVLCVSCDGLLRLLSLDGKLDMEEKIFEQKNMCYSSPIVYQNRLFIGSRDNYLYSFKII